MPNFDSFIQKYREEIEHKILSEVGKSPGLSHEELAKRVQLDRKTLRNHTKRLIQAGRLSSAGRTRGRSGNDYQLGKYVVYLKNVPFTYVNENSQAIAAADR
jgi:predicted transcriptional regulator